MRTDGVQTEVFLVRHGETDWNREERIQGHRDVPLNSRGIWQAEQLASSFAAIAIDQIYSSDLKRALATAEPIARMQGMGVQPDSRLRERDYGRDAGRTAAEMAELRRMGALAGVEDWDAMRKRVGHFIQQMAKDHLGERLLFVTHGGAIGAALHYLIGSPEEIRERRLQNASVSLLFFNGSDWRIGYWNRLDHLVGSSDFSGGWE